MADAALEWRDDFGLTPDGDLAIVDGPDETRERILRRLLTALRGYCWHPSYGAGLPSRIGNVARESVIQSVVRSQIRLEASVARTPVPTVAVSTTSLNQGLYVIAIGYTDAVTGAATAISLQVPER